MFGNNTEDAPSRSLAGRAFMRRRLHRATFRRSLAALPLIAVAAFVFDASAPAGTTPAEPIAATQQVEGRWSLGDARQLLSLIEDSADEGLNPGNYNAEALRSAIDAGNRGDALDALATASALSLAHDYADGRIDDKEAFDWHFAPSTDLNTLAVGLSDALDHDRLAPWLRGLLPDNPQYRALRVAYAAAEGNPELRDELRVNLERWRWMPRDLGERYIYVNVPSYQLSLVEGGLVQASYNVVVGAPKTPTPQLALQAQTIVANPGWTLPPSVLREGAPRGKGYQRIARADGSYTYFQPPGPNNALGRIKIDMPNPHAIYLHDTPAKAAFNREKRALSHGCVRVQNIHELAAMLGDGTRLDEALANPHKTRRLELQQSVPVYLVYFTMEARPDGQIHYLGDPYGRDAAMLERLGAEANGPMRMAVAER